MDEGLRAWESQRCGFDIQIAFSSDVGTNYSTL